MKSIAIIGFAHQGLAIARLFGAAGYEVNILALPNEYNRFEFHLSKYVRSRVSRVSDSDEIEKKLEEIQVHNAEKLLVIITSADAINTLSLYKPVLWVRYDVLSGPLSAIQMLSNKALLYNKLRYKDFVLASEYDENTRIKYPVVLKRNEERPEIYSYKFHYFDTEVSLLAFLKDVPNEIKQYLIIQSAFPSNTVALDFRGFIRGGKIIGSQVVREIRAWPAGVPSYLEEETNKQLLLRISNSLGDLFKEVNYSGFIGIDIAYLPSEDSFFVLDINTRPPASVTSWIKKYRRRDLRDFALTIDDPKELVSRRTVRWVNTMRDIEARIYTKDLRGIICSLLARKDMYWEGDPVPTFLNPFCTLYRIINKRYNE